MKHMSRAFFVILFLSIGSITFAQKRLVGRVVDSENKKGIKDVSITVSGKDFKTLSNSRGYFEIDADSSDYLIIEKRFYTTSKASPSRTGAVQISLKKRTEAEYTDGMDNFYRLVTQKVNYPKSARLNRTQGRTYLSFEVDTMGTMHRVNIVSDIGNGCGDEIKRVLESIPGNWNPAEIPTTFILPVTFRLGDSNKYSNVPQLPRGTVLEEIVVSAIVVR
jgi:hypothetical protein